MSAPADLQSPRGGSGVRICVSLAEPDEAALSRSFGRLDGADLVEVRLDALSPAPEAPRGFADLATRLMSSCPVPVGFTLRPTWQGGAFDGDEAARRATLEKIAEAGPAFVDVELDAAWVAEMVSATPCPVIVSHHWGRPRPGDLDDRVRQLRALAPWMAKLVATAETQADTLPLLAAGEALIASGQPATCFCMGEAGMSSRLLAAGRGAALIYASVGAGQEVAAGQWTLRQLVDVFGIQRWSPPVTFCGLIGHPIGHSLSPALFNAAFRDAGPDLAYVPVPGADLDDVLALVIAMRFRGVSVTMPFKEQMAALSGTQGPLVRTTRAANTVVFSRFVDSAPDEADRAAGAEGAMLVTDDAARAGWAAFNTDGAAVVDALQAVRPVAGARVAIVGAGGAARAAAVALVTAGAEVTIVNRTAERAAQVAALAGGVSGPVEALEGAHPDIVINATPVGMTGTGSEDETPFPVSWLDGGEVVFDMVYRPRQTKLLQEASARGCVTVEGLEMFVRQAATQYRHLTGGDADGPLVSMRAAAERMLRKDSVATQSKAHRGTNDL